MPGCKPQDLCVQIDAHREPLKSNIGTFHTVVRRCPCHSTWWEVQAEQDCKGFIGSMADFDIIVPICRGGCHCMPDACLQPIRPGKKRDELPPEVVAPTKELEKV